MNSGTAEQEQKCVTMPSLAARALPTPSRRPASSARVRSGAKKVWHYTHEKNDAGQQEQHLGRVVEEEMHRLAELGRAGQAQAGDRQIGEFGEMGIAQHPERSGDGQADESGGEALGFSRDGWVHVSIASVRMTLKTSQPQKGCTRLRRSERSLPRFRSYRCGRVHAEAAVDRARRRAGPQMFEQGCP